MNQPKFRRSLGATAAALGISLFASTASAAVNFTPGDLLMGFQSTGGIGAGNVYVYNIGQAYTYRDNPALGFVANLNTDLAATFGATWFSRTDLHWSIGGVRINDAFGANANVVENGDPARAFYTSKEASGIGTTLPNSVLATANVNTTATRMMDTQSGFRTSNTVIPREATLSSNGNGVIQNVGDINSWSSRVPVTTGGIAPWTTISFTVHANFGTNTPLVYQDLYRTLSDNNNLPGVAEPAPRGTFVYQTTLTMDSLGNLNAVPEPSVTLLGGLLTGAALLRRRRSL